MKIQIDVWDYVIKLNKVRYNMSYFRFLAGLLAFMLLVVTIVFFRDNNMNWWLFMFAFIIVAGFMAQPYDDKHNKRDNWDDYPNDWEEYKASYVEPEYDDTDWVVIAMNNRDFEIANKTPDDEENEEIPF